MCICTATVHSSINYAWEHFYKTCTDFDDQSHAMILDCSLWRNFGEATVLLPCLKNNQLDTVKNLALEYIEYLLTKVYGKTLNASVSYGQNYGEKKIAIHKTFCIWNKV